MSRGIRHRYTWWLPVMWARLVLVAVLVALLVIVVPVYGAGAATAAAGGRVISAPCVHVDSTADRREALLVVGDRAADKRFHATVADRGAQLEFG